MVVHFFLPFLMITPVWGTPSHKDSVFPISAHPVITSSASEDAIEIWQSHCRYILCVVVSLLMPCCRELVALWADEYGPALSLLRRIFPVGLVRSLNTPLHPRPPTHGAPHLRSQSHVPVHSRVPSQGLWDMPPPTVPVPPIQRTASQVCPCCCEQWLLHPQPVEGSVHIFCICVLYIPCLRLCI